MGLELTGRVAKLFPAQSGVSKAGKQWYRQDFMIETDGKYPKLVSFCVNDDKKVLPSIGTEVMVSFNAESREYNDKVYTTLYAYKVEAVAYEKSSVSQEPENLNADKGTPDDLPF